MTARAPAYSFTSTTRGEAQTLRPHAGSASLPSRRSPNHDPFQMIPAPDSRLSHASEEETMFVSEKKKKTTNPEDVYHLFLCFLRRTGDPAVGLGWRSWTCPAPPHGSPWPRRRDGEAATGQGGRGGRVRADPVLPGGPRLPVSHFVRRQCSNADGISLFFFFSCF